MNPYPITVQEDIHGDGEEHTEGYAFPREKGDAWYDPITNVPCPVEGCDQTLVWYEAGYVPGYRVCMRSLGDGYFDHASRHHRFALVTSTLDDELQQPTVLVRDKCCESASVD